MTLKNAAFVALVGMILLTVLLLFRNPITWHLAHERRATFYGHDLATPHAKLVPQTAFAGWRVPGSREWLVMPVADGNNVEVPVWTLQRPYHIGDPLVVDSRRPDRSLGSAPW